MKKTLIEIFKPNPKSLTLNDIKNALGYKTITNVQKRHIVKNLLKLELDGKIYYDFVNNCYYVFPSNFFVSKVNKITDNKMIFAINGEFQEIDIKNNEVRKKDYIIVRKENDGYKLVKVIGKVQELDSVDDLERIYNLFNPYSVSYTFKELLKITKVDEKELREDKDLYQKDIANYLKIDQSNYSKYELEKVNIPVDYLRLLADYYNTSIDYILYRTDERKPYTKSIMKK